VIRNALEAVKTPDGVGGVLAHPPPKVRIRRVTETGVEYLVRYRILPSRVSPIDGQHLVNEAVLNRLHDAGIALAPNQRAPDDRPATGSV
jgi:hypothetical protein